MLANELKKSFIVSLWFMFLTFPIMVIRVNTVQNIVEWRWGNLLLVAVGSFVLSALWRYMIRRKEQGIKKVRMVPDGSGDFTKGMGMLVEKHNLGFGLRSWRYAAIINDGEIEKWFIEPGKENNCEDDPYGETDPVHILENI